MNNSARWVLYLLAVFAVAIAIVARLLLDPLLHDGLPFITLYAAVACAAWLGGRGPALFGLVVSAVAAAYFLIEPRFSFAINQTEYQFGLIVYVIFGLALIAVFDALERKQRWLEQEIAARRTTELILVEREEFLRVTLASIGDAVITTNLKGDVINLNEVARELTGWTEDKARGQPLNKVFHIINEESRQPVESPVTKALREGRVVGLANHTLLVSKDGTERPIEDSAAPIRNRSNEVVGCVLVFRDVTERRRMELQDAERNAAARLLASVVGSSDDAIVSKSLDGIIQSWNTAAERLFGYTPEQVVGRHISLLIPSDRADEHNYIITRLRAGERINHFDTLRMRSDGTVFPVSLTISPVKDEQGRVIGASKIARDITDRKRTEEELVRLATESERQRRLYETVLGNTPDFVYVFSLDYRVLYANDSLIRMWGLGEETAIGKTLLEIGYEPWHAELHNREIDQVRTTRQPIRGEVPFTGTNGRRMYEYIFVPIIGADGEVEAVTGTTRDVTDQKRSETELRESAERLRLALDSADMGTWERDVNTGEIEWSAKTRELFGVAADTPVDYELFESLLHPDDLGPNRRKTDESLQTGEFENEFRVLLPSGVRWISSRGRLQRNDHGKHDRMLGVITDVTQRKRYEKEREDSERTLATLIERCPFGIYIVDADFRIANVNAGSQDGAFRNVRPIIGRPFDEAMRIIWTEHVATEIVNNFRHTMDTGEPYSSKDFVNSRADTGETEGYEWELHRITLPNGRYGVVCYYFDATRLRRAEQELREADRRKDEFLATLAHELRNPLAPVKNSLELIKWSSGEDKIEQARATMERQIGHMVRLIDDLLDVSRITRDKLELKKEPIELDSVVHHAVEACRPLAERAGHELIVELPPEPTYLTADPVRLAQVIGNLLTNSCKYMPPGGRIWLTVEPQGGYVAVKVKDAGIGIPPEMLAKVFDLFTQVDRAMERSEGGLGIGLSLVKRLVELHNGTVTARSEGQNKGSEFEIRLPIQIENSSPTPTPRQITLPKKTKARRILVVDDNRDAAATLALLLKFTGNETQTANDGLTALATAEKFQPHILLLDIGLPKMNGLEVCRHIREQPWGKDMVVVALTGWGQDEDRRKSTDAGFNHHLVKPVDHTALMALIESLEASERRA